MSDAIAGRDRDLGNFIAGPLLSAYQTRFSEHFALERRAGVLTIRTHRDGQAAPWSRGLLNAWNLLLAEVGADRDNELIIITGTGNYWLDGVEARSFAQPLSQWDGDLIAEQYNDGVKILERLAFDIDVPAIAVINGPGPRLELPLLCDLTLCAPDVVFADGNFRAGSVPGDGMYLVLRELIGVKRASHAVYSGQGITAEEARLLGMVNEVLPRADLLPPGTRPCHADHGQAPYRPPPDSRRDQPDMATRPGRRTAGFLCSSAFRNDL